MGSPAPRAVHHPIFARFYRRLSEASDAMIARHRVELLDGLEGRVVEVGCGNGLNFAHYPATVTEVLAVEPEEYLRSLAVAAAERCSVPVDVVPGLADELPLDDASVDAVVFSLVLCSVPDQADALAEAARVLRPGGEVRFYEHVLSDTPRLAGVQRGADVVWPHLFGGCHTSRDTVGAIRDAGFADVEVRDLRLDIGPFPHPVSPHALGRARRPV